MKDKRIKRCPFCEEPAEISQLPFNPDEILSNKWVIGCDGKNGSLCPGYIWKCTPFYLTIDQAIEYWNTRATIAVLDLNAPQATEGGDPIE